METPPETTLSTPFPTELRDHDPVAAEMNKIALRSKPIYLVVATTPCTVPSSSGASQSRLGIGMNGQLPWPMIKADMSYFKDVTEKGARAGNDATANTVIMGRKTYFSIPEKFRPLIDRRNVIVTRSSAAEVGKQVLDGLLVRQEQAKTWARNKFGEAWSNLDIRSDDGNTAQEIKRLRLAQAGFRVDHEDSRDGVYVSADNDSVSSVHVCQSPETAVETAEAEASGIFCIGGSEIYSAFLKNDALRPRLRILQTEIQKVNDTEDFECDTFWPEELSEADGWEEAEPHHVAAWTGINLPQKDSDWASDEKVGVRLRVRGWKQAVK